MIPFGTMLDNEIGDGQPVIQTSDEARFLQLGPIGNMNVFPPADERLNSSGFVMMNSSSFSYGRASRQDGQQLLASSQKMEPSSPTSESRLSDMLTRRSTLRATASSEQDRGVRHQPPASRINRESNPPSRELRTYSRPPRQLKIFCLLRV